MNIDFTNVSKHYAARTHEKMKEVLMDPNSIGPSIHYYMIRGGVNQKNITIWEPGTVSGEYIKTYGHYHVGKLDETYWILYGEGIALLQRISTDSVVEDFKAIIVKPGDSVYMPEGYGHLLVNTGLTYFATADDSPVHFTDVDTSSMPGHADYEPVKRMQGFAYYVIEQNGKPILKRNSKYTQIKKQDLGGLAILQ